MAELIESHPAFGADALTLLEPVAALRRRRTAGGSGPDAVAVQLERFAARMREDAERVAASRH
jgi:argininosuccinate lyase